MMLKADKTRPYAVYVAVAGPYVKIGITSNPSNRLATLNCACPFRVGFFDYVQVHSQDLALHIERSVHRRMSEFRQNGEWFDVDPEMAWDEVVTSANQIYNCGGCAHV